MGDPAVPLVTAAEFDLDVIAPATRFLSLTVGEGDDRGKRRFPVRGDLSIPEVALLRRIERELQTRVGDDDGRAVMDTFDELHAFVTRLVREQTPDTPELKITYQQAMPLLSWLAGDTSFADKIAHALTDGAHEAQTAEEAAATGDTAAAVGESAGGTDGPLPSSTPSASASSPSDERTAGRPAGGMSRVAPPPASPGASSARTSETPVPA